MVLKLFLDIVVVGGGGDNTATLVARYRYKNNL